MTETLEDSGTLSPPREAPTPGSGAAAQIPAEARAAMTSKIRGPIPAPGCTDFDLALVLLKTDTEVLASAGPDTTLLAVT